MKRHIEEPRPTDNLSLLQHERIEGATFRRAVDFLDRGDAQSLRAHLMAHSNLVRQHVTLEGGNYFRNPTLLEFVAENPVRRGTLPANIVEVTRVILDAGAKGSQSALNETLGHRRSTSRRRSERKPLQPGVLQLFCSRRGRAGFRHRWTRPRWSSRREGS